MAYDSFKGSLTSWEVGDAVEQGLLDTEVPLCTGIVAIGDGGEKYSANGLPWTSRLFTERVEIAI
ncbi:MAG: glycerate kinase [Tissierellia bacterium]|nr:glycerate kinase [Tissierellia bacterium]